MYLESKDKNAIESHSFSIYKFFKKDFQYINASDEFISNKSLKPISEARKQNPVKFLLDNDYDVEFVDDLKKTLKSIKKEGISYDTEGI